MRFLRFITSVTLSLSLLFLCACDGSDTAAGEAVFLNKTIGALANSDEYAVAESYKAMGATVLGFGSVEDALFSLENGKIDYIIADEATAYTLLKDNSDLKTAEECTETEELCAYFPKNSDLLLSFNEAVSRLLQDGTVENIKNSAFSGVDYNGTAGDFEETLVLATAETGFPFCEDSYGVLRGIDVSVAYEAAALMGRSLEIRVYEFDELFDAVLCGEADFLMAAALPETARSEDFAFSSPYYTVRYVVLSF